MSKHNIKLNVFAHVKGDDCGERTLGCLSGDGVVDGGGVNSVRSLVELPKGEGHAGVSESGGEGNRRPHVVYEKGSHSAV